MGADPRDSAEAPTVDAKDVPEDMTRTIGHSDLTVDKSGLQDALHLVLPVDGCQAVCHENKDVPPRISFPTEKNVRNDETGRFEKPAGHLSGGDWQGPVKTSRRKAPRACHRSGSRETAHSERHRPPDKMPRASLGKLQNLHVKTPGPTRTHEALVPLRQRRGSLESPTGTAQSSVQKQTPMSSESPLN